MALCACTPTSESVPTSTAPATSLGPEAASEPTTPGSESDDPPGPSPLPAGFVYVRDVIPDIVVELRYQGSHNFVGAPVDGYEAPRLVLGQAATAALAQAQLALRPSGLGLKVFDGYRPQRAVDHFVRWAQDLADTRQKAEFYPNVDKRDLFDEGYIARRSGHTRGSTLDLTLIRLEDGAELDMGTPWDFFGPESWYAHDGITPQQRANRDRLHGVMVAHGFKPYAKEWWHFTLANEPFPETYFDFPIR